jgi:adenine-specific DNA glycosylase
MARCERAHTFSPSEITLVREKLLSWYDASRRDLPWREKKVREPEMNDFGGNVSLPMFSFSSTLTRTR